MLFSSKVGPYSEKLEPRAWRNAAFGLHFQDLGNSFPHTYTDLLDGKEHLFSLIMFW